MVKTPLRYPGGKSRAVKHILPLIPPDVTELCSPFLGGGSVELAFNQERGGTVYGYDIFEPLIWFWEYLLQSPKELAEAADQLRVTHKDFVVTKKTKKDGKVVATINRGLLRTKFAQIREELKEAKCGSIENAAKFYAINRSTFSGATFSGGWSNEAAHARFTDSSIERVRKFKVENFNVGCDSFHTSIIEHPNSFLYCDPPYLLGKGKDTLYGIVGSTHRGFPHMDLYDILSRRSGWVLSYNNRQEIRDLYSNYEIVEAEWAYGMKNIRGKDLPKTEKKKMGTSSELLIIG